MPHFFLVLVFAFFSALAAPAGAESLHGKVFAVIDGDTLLFKTDAQASARARAFIKVRLADIDAPEADQPHGDAATRALTALTLNQRVALHIVAHDNYGRTVARVHVGEQDIHATLVRDGHVWASRFHPDKTLVALEKSARAARRGLWRDADAMPPWRWRKR
jgi:endonuclease YncB( thermonuclease family)